MSRYGWARPGLVRRGTAWHGVAGMGNARKEKIKMVFKYKATKYKVPAQVAGEYLHKLDEDGGLTAERLLDESRPKNALLHGCFEWDNTKAAEAHRLFQARYFIGNIVVAQIEDNPVTPVRAFVNVSDASRAQKALYRPVRAALSDGASRETVLANALRELEIFRDKYGALTELTAVIDAIDAVIGGKA